MLPTASHSRIAAETAGTKTQAFFRLRGDSRLNATLLAFLAVVLADCRDVNAQEVVLTSDRPGFANTSAIAAKHRPTIETGVSVGFEDAGTNGALPSISARTGLSPWLELRLRAPDISWLDGSDKTNVGLTDPRLGLKIGGTVTSNFALSSVWEVSVPAGSREFGGGVALTRIDFNVDWIFWGPFSLTPNGVASTVSGVNSVGDVEPIFEGGGSLKLSAQLPKGFSMFVQTFALRNEDSDWRVQLGGAVIYQASPWIQFDLGFDGGLNEDAQAPTAIAGSTVAW